MYLHCYYTELGTIRENIAHMEILFPTTLNENCLNLDATALGVLLKC